MKKKAVKKIANGEVKALKKKKGGTGRKPLLPIYAETVAFSPDVVKRDLVRQTIITILWRKEEVTETTLMAELKREIGHQFDGDLVSYLELVKNDLIQWKLMEASPGKKVAYYRLAQKLDKKDDD